ncbi:MAG: SsrA-binding protein SmpB [Clostridia bacterium]|nr:SsrA-binding protein SmpB [Clostridia bacterium]
MKVIAENRQARFNYFLHDTFEAGLSLQGWEVKSARAGHVTITESFIHLEFASGKIWLKNAYFAPYQNGVVAEQDTRRNRQLLLHKSEIAKIAKAINVKGNTCVPLKVYWTNNGLLKISIAIATGKNVVDKKQTIKERDLAREAARVIASLKNIED